MPRAAVLLRSRCNEFGVQLASPARITAEQRQHPARGEERRLRLLADHRVVAAPPPVARIRHESGPHGIDAM
jgi:hypothetical protein